MNYSESHADDLARIGALRIDDLETNRSGCLSERQKRTLYLNLVLWCGIAAVEISVFIGLMYLQILIQANLIITAVGILLLVLAYSCIKEAKPFWKDIQNDEAKSVTGMIYKNFHVTGGNTRGSKIAFCSIRVDDEIFAVSPLLYDHVIHENRYRVYFSSNARKIINIEPL